MKNLHSEKIISNFIKSANKANNKILPDLWIISDCLGGINHSKEKLVKSFEKLNQNNSDVKILKKELGL